MINCKGCGILTNNTKYCSRKCSGKESGKSSCGRRHSKETKIKLSLINGGSGEISEGICLYCGKQVCKKFCDGNCKSKYDYEKKVEKWLAGEIDGVTKYGPSGFIKRYLIETYGEKCMECGWAERNTHSGNIPIELEHIDGNSKNNRPENLKLLCPNCHSLTSTYKAMNKGNGNKYRLERYHKEKAGVA